VEFRAAFLFPLALTVLLPDGSAAQSAKPPNNIHLPSMLLPKIKSAPLPLQPAATTQRSAFPEFLLLPPSGEAVAITRSSSSRKSANPDADLTIQLRRWQTVASSAGSQPYSWGLSGDVAARIALGLQSALFFTDNIYFQTPNRAREETMFEISPIIKLDLGDPQAWLNSMPTKQAKYYASLLYMPTFYHHLGEKVDDYAQHFLGEAGRMNEISRVVLRLEYDERLLISSENTSPEENYTLLDASALVERRFATRFTLRGKSGYKRVEVVPATTNRETLTGEISATLEVSPKTKVGLGGEIGNVMFEQDALGTQDYQQAFFTIDWRPTPKIGLTTRTGLEWRQFNRLPTPPMKTSIITQTGFFWQPSDKTRLNLSLRAANQPSVLAQGTLFREIRFGPDFTHDFTPHFYSAAELYVARRRYDTGRLDWEPMGRLSVGWREDPDKSFNRLNVELFVQWHRRERNDLANADAQRSQVGLQVTKFF
jgi:hypothetical protein